VSHDKLLLRLYSYGIRGLVLEWTAQFFRDRTQQTIVGECLSPRAQVLSGVVQGSGIRPVLFLIYIDDLAKLPSGRPHQFWLRTIKGDFKTQNIGLSSPWRIAHRRSRWHRVEETATGGARHSMMIMMMMMMMRGKKSK